MKTCPVCGGPSYNVSGPECFHCLNERNPYREIQVAAQDRTRFKDYSTVLGPGAAPPESHSDLRRIERERNIQFGGAFTPQEERLREYSKHVRAGGERLPSEVVNPPEKIISKSVQQILTEKNVKLHP